MPAGDGDSAAVLTTLVDVTGRREVEAALSRSETQFRVAMENAPIGMALVDLEWRIVEANAAFAELLGTSVGALRGYPMADLSTPESRPAERLEVDRLLGGGQHRFSLEKRYQRADGHLVWVVLDTALVRTPDRRAGPLRRAGARLDRVAAAGRDAHAPRDARPAHRAGEPHAAAGGPPVGARAARRRRPRRRARVRPRRLQGDQRPVRPRRGRRGARARRGRAARGDRASRDRRAARRRRVRGRRAGPRRPEGGVRGRRGDPRGPPGAGPGRAAPAERGGEHRHRAGRPRERSRAGRPACSPRPTRRCTGPRPRAAAAPRCTSRR